MDTTATKDPRLLGLNGSYVAIAKITKIDSIALALCGGIAAMLRGKDITDEVKRAELRQQLDGFVIGAVLPLQTNHLIPVAETPLICQALDMAYLYVYGGNKDVARRHKMNERAAVVAYRSAFGVNTNGLVGPTESWQIGKDVVTLFQEVHQDGFGAWIAKQGPALTSRVASS
ncbi:MAG TPA: hypothetical protein VG984_03965 [Candidatus Paceibacterota bacterium]|nr:hypothetical protein [Candidatus Paceibacterota bacterium]